MRWALAYLLAGNMTMVAVLGAFDMGSSRPGHIVAYVAAVQVGALMWPIALVGLMFRPPSPSQLAKVCEA